MLSQDRRTVLNRAIRQRLGVPTSTTTTQEEASTMTAHTTPALTPRTLALFLEYARDAGNWSGTPLVGGNVGGSKEDRGNITQMKRAGLVTTFVDEGNTWLEFTAAGALYAVANGVTTMQAEFSYQTILDVIDAAGHAPPEGGYKDAEALFEKIIAVSEVDLMKLVAVALGKAKEAKRAAKVTTK